MSNYHNLFTNSLLKNSFIYSFINSFVCLLFSYYFAARINVLSLSLPGWRCQGCVRSWSLPKNLPSPLGPLLFKDFYALSTLLRTALLLFSQFEGRDPLKFSHFAHCRHFGSASPQTMFHGATYAHFLHLKINKRNIDKKAIESP